MKEGGDDEPKNEGAEDAQADEEKPLTEEEKKSE